MYKKNNLVFFLIIKLSRQLCTSYSSRSQKLPLFPLMIISSNLRQLFALSKRHPSSVFSNLCTKPQVAYRIIHSGKFRSPPQTIHKFVYEIQKLEYLYKPMQTNKKRNNFREQLGTGYIKHANQHVLVCLRHYSLTSTHSER